MGRNIKELEALAFRIMQLRHFADHEEANIEEDQEKAEDDVELPGIREVELECRY
jgi:hypothetical protein